MGRVGKGGEGWKRVRKGEEVWGKVGRVGEGGGGWGRVENGIEG